MSRAAGERTSNIALTHSMPKISLVADGGSDVPVPPPSCLNCANTSRYTSATTQLPIAKYGPRRRNTTNAVGTANTAAISPDSTTAAIGSMPAPIVSANSR